MRQKVDLTEERACEHGGRDWREAITHQWILITTAGEKS